jgi:hypothetical protein
LQREITALVHGLFSELAVSPAASDHGVSGDQLLRFAREVASDPYRFRNQIGEITEQLIYEFYENSHRGV